VGNSVDTEPVVRFHDFQVNLETGELWKAGVRLKLQDQPFKVLAALLQRPGQIVAREELRQLVWPQENFGDFDHAVNLAVNKLRSTLGDSADVPHLIETLPRRGYRFIARIESASEPNQGVGAATVGPPSRWPFRAFDGIRKRPWLAAGVTALLLMGIFVAVKRSSHLHSSLPVTRSVVKLEPGYMLDGFRLPSPLGFGQPTRAAMAISSDGRFIIYSASREIPERHEKPQLYLRRTDQLEAKPIAGTEGGVTPFLSPDDRWVGFWADGKLKKVAIDGGVPVVLCDQIVLSEARWGPEASWGPFNQIVVAAGYKDTRLYMLSSDGGNLQILNTSDRSKERFSHQQLPHWLPDGTGVLLTTLRDWFDLHPRVAVLDLKTKDLRVLLEDAADAFYVATGHLVFLREGTLMVVPFDLDRRKVAGEPVPAVVNVMQALNTGPLNSAAGQFSVSDSGWLLYAVGGINQDREDSLVWIDQKGNATPITSYKAPFWAPRLSPDGQRAAYITEGREWHAWTYDLKRGTATRLTGEGKADFALWTPDGKHLAFKWWRAGEESNLYWQLADGSSPMERLTTSQNHQVPASFSPDGATLAFVELDPDTGFDINLLDMKSRRVTAFLNSKSDELWPDFSPDGHWMAYVSNESGRCEVYVRPYPGPGSKFQVSPEGGEAPLWSRNGKQLFYVAGPREYWVADVRTDRSFSASKPRLLFKSVELMADGLPSRSWDISLDGQRFLGVRPSERKPQPVTELILVQNWFEELKRLAPGKN
jgi:eukaryotic-like serine/threonine-protein kinase